MSCELVPQLMGREPERLLFARVRFDSIGKEPPAPQLAGSVPAVHHTGVSARQCACPLQASWMGSPLSVEAESLQCIFPCLLLAEGIPAVCIRPMRSSLSQGKLLNMVHSLTREA